MYTFGSSIEVLEHLFIEPIELKPGKIFDKEVINIYTDEYKQEIYIKLKKNVTVKVCPPSNPEICIPNSGNGYPISISDVEEVVFLFQENYVQYEKKLSKLKIKSSYIGHHTNIEFLIHQTSFKNLEKILSSNKLMTVGEADKIRAEKVYNDGILRRKIIPYTNEVIKLPETALLSYEIDGVYFRVKFKGEKFYADEQIDNPIFFYLSPKILDDYDWHMNYVDQFGFPDRRTVFKKDRKYMVDNPEFLENMFELIVYKEIKNLSQYIVFVCIPDSFKKDFDASKTSVPIKWRRVDTSCLG